VIKGMNAEGSLHMILEEGDGGRDTPAVGAGGSSEEGA